jgi:hypothetical protein
MIKWNTDFTGTQPWTLRKLGPYQTYPVGSEMWCWIMMEEISWKDRMKNEQYYTEQRRRGTS